MRVKNRLFLGMLASLAAAGSLVAVSATSASATTPTGGCWVYSPTTASNIEDTVPSSSTSTALAAWADSTASPAGDADYSITTSGNSVVGQSRDFSLTFNKGPKNGGPPAGGTVYYYFSVNGTNLPVISKAFSAPGAGTIPGDTVTGSYTITAAGAQSVKLRKVIYDIPTFTIRVQCNGQSTGVSGGVNPATTPVDTNIASASFTAIGPTATISSIGNQVVTTAARKGDDINFNVTNFTAGTATAALCDTSGANCDVTTNTLTVAGDGTGSGTLTVQSSPTTGARALKVTSGTDVSLTPITILANPTFTTNLAGGGAGSVVSFSGTGWDPNQSVTVGGYKAGPPYPPGATTDATINVTASATGAISGSYTVNDTLTAYVGGARIHATTPSTVQIFASAAFAFSGDSCQAKAGAATTGTCSLLETVNLTVTAGNLTTSKVSGNVLMSGVTLNGVAQTSTGSLQDVTVKDYRGGALGWSLTGKFSGLNGPATIAPNKLTWTPSCVAGSNNDDTLTTGAAGAFTDASTALPACSVATTGLGADGTSGGDTTVDAGLSLQLGANQAAGSYVGTLTLTLS